MHKCNSGKVAIFVLIIIVVIGAIGWRWWGAKQESPVTGAAAPGISATRSGGAPVSVTTTVVKKQDLPVSVIANGTVVALQSVEIRSQISATVRAIHFKEGATVRQGELLFTMDNRTEEATQKRADAQVLKSRADYANAERNLKRQRELFEQKFISAAGLDAAMNQFELLKAQLAVDTASAEVARVAKSLTEIRAPFAGRTGAINVRIGSLVQPAAASPALVTISQIDPIGVSFSIPERERPFIQKALSSGDVSVTAEIPAPATQKLTGKLSFVESTIDTASGTIPMKAVFGNKQLALWPGMFVNITVPTRTIEDTSVVPAQAVQTGPDRKYVYVVSAENKATIQPVDVLQIQNGLAAISGVAPGTRIVLEGAQNVRPNGTVVEGVPKGAKKDDGKGGEQEGKSANTQASPADKPTASPPNSEKKSESLPPKK
jgi:RND family efflux transporter MFP subunit